MSIYRAILEGGCNRWEEWKWMWGGGHSCACSCCDLCLDWNTVRWCWERLKAGGEGGDRGREGGMASLTQWTWVWANSGRWWRTGKAGVRGVTKTQPQLSNWTRQEWRQVTTGSGQGRNQNTSLIPMEELTHMEKTHWNCWCRTINPSKARTERFRVFQATFENPTSRF